MPDLSVDEKLDRISDQLAQLIKHVAEVRGSNRRLENRLDRVENRIDTMDARLDRMEKRLDRVEKRIDTMDACLNRIDARLDRTNTRLDEVATHVKLKIDHFSEYMVKEQSRLRHRIEEESAERKADITLLKEKL